VKFEDIKEGALLVCTSNTGTSHRENEIIKIAKVFIHDRIQKVHSHITLNKYPEHTGWIWPEVLREPTVDELVNYHKINQTL
jgi:hypothetical protein